MDFKNQSWNFIGLYHFCRICSLNFQKWPLSRDAWVFGHPTWDTQGLIFRWAEVRSHWRAKDGNPKLKCTKSQAAFEKVGFSLSEEETVACYVQSGPEAELESLPPIDPQDTDHTHTGEILRGGFHFLCAVWGRNSTLLHGGCIWIR